MARTRISTTVSDERLTAARALAPWGNDAELIDAALEALILQHGRAVIDAAYRKGYTDAPLDVADEWGDLASFRAAAARS
ncbi:hypothetical protein BH23ACT9_BH23ACT9_16230 [soil metagenome]